MGSLPLSPLEAIETAQAPAPVGPYNQAVRAGNLLFCSGQIALDPASGSLVGAGDVALETRQVLANLLAVLDAAGAKPSQVVRTTVFLADLADFATVNGLYAEVFGAGVSPGGGVAQGRPRRDRRHRRSRLNPGPHGAGGSA